MELDAPSPPSAAHALLVIVILPRPAAVVYQEYTRLLFN